MGLESGAAWLAGPGSETLMKLQSGCGQTELGVWKAKTASSGNQESWCLELLALGMGWDIGHGSREDGPPGLQLLCVYHVGSTGILAEAAPCSGGQVRCRPCGRLDRRGSDGDTGL